MVAAPEPVHAVVYQEVGEVEDEVTCSADDQSANSRFHHGSSGGAASTEVGVR